jgi:hypothetical protein
MPFNPSTGVYTPPNGAENAFPGEVIASATWNAIFTDISTALTQLGQQQITFLPRSVTVPGNISIATTDRVVLIQANVGTITLPASATKLNPVTIVGNASGIFGTHNALITPNGSEKIDGLNNMTLANDYQSITLLPLASGGWVATS